VRSLFDILSVPGEVQTLIYTLAIIMIAAFFAAGVDLGIFKIPPLTKSQRRTSFLAGLVLLAVCLVASYRFFPEENQTDDQIFQTSRNEEVLKLPGSLNGMNDIGLIDTFSSTVVRRSDFRLGLKIREDVDNRLLSCISLYFCKPETANICTLTKQQIYPIRGKQNIFVSRIGDTFEPGNNKVHIKIVQVKNISDLATGGQSIEHSRLHAVW